MNCLKMETTGTTLFNTVKAEQMVTNGNNENNIGIFASNAANDNSDKSQEIRCFVCDVKVQGRHYALATCRTQSTRTRVIEKLGELVGERYMVVISEDDVICRSCANLINTLDRLESEMHNVRDNVLRFLEQKYSLEEGELLGSNNMPKPCQPPQITKCNLSGNDKKKDENSVSGVTDKGRCKKSNIWMQCDKCQYTTHYNSFMIHHIRDHIKQKISCDKCGIQFLREPQEAIHKCDKKDEMNKTLKETVKNLPTKSAEETIEVSVPENSIVQNLPMISIQTYTQDNMQISSEDMSLMQLSNPENLQLQSILTPDGMSVSCQPMYVRVLQHINNDEAVAHQSMITSSETEMLMKVKDATGKQMLTLMEDGNLVEMSWSDLQQSADIDPSLQFT